MAKSGQLAVVAVWFCAILVAGWLLIGIGDWFLTVPLLVGEVAMVVGIAVLGPRHSRQASAEVRPTGPRLGTPLSPRPGDAKVK